jgi:hypothetical protein
MQRLLCATDPGEHFSSPKGSLHRWMKPGAQVKFRIGKPKAGNIICGRKRVKAKDQSPVPILAERKRLQSPDKSVCSEST